MMMPEKTNPMQMKMVQFKLISDKNNNCASKKRRRSNQNNIYTGRIRIGGTAIDDDTGRIDTWRLGS
jgi:hypothetical protein